MYTTQLILDEQRSILSAVTPILPFLQNLPPLMEALRTIVTEKLRELATSLNDRLRSGTSPVPHLRGSGPSLSMGSLLYRRRPWLLLNLPGFLERSLASWTRIETHNLRAKVLTAGKERPLRCCLLLHQFLLRLVHKSPLIFSHRINTHRTWQPHAGIETFSLYRPSAAVCFTKAS